MKCTAKTFILLLLPLWLFSWFDPKASDQHFLLTYPRSGTNLTSCYIQALTGMPIRRMEQDITEETHISENRLSLALDYSKPVLFREHSGENLRSFNKKGNRLLFVLRNYKESICREARPTSAEKFRDLFVTDSDTLQHYMNNIRVFDEWDPQRRLLVYYEDLISDPLATVKRILAFLNEPEPECLTQDFLSEVREKALLSYDTQHAKHGGSHSKGEDLEFHSKKIPPQYRQQIDTVVAVYYPILWKKYLKRYVR